MESGAESPVRLVVPVQWGEMDALGHVNNIVFLRWFESVRMKYFLSCHVLDRVKTENVGPILASTSVTFRAPVTYPDTVTAEATVPRVGNSSFTMNYTLKSAGLDDAVVAECEATIVMVDYGSGRSVRVPDDVREAIERLEEG